MKVNKVTVLTGPLLLAVLTISAAPQKKSGVKPSAQPARASKTSAVIFKTHVPGAAQITASIVSDAAKVQWANLKSDADVATRRRLLTALAMLGRPDIAARYVGSQWNEEEEVWRLTARYQAELGNLSAARQALSKSSHPGTRLDALFAIARAQLRANDRLGANTTLLQAIPLMKENDDATANAYGAYLFTKAGNGNTAAKILAWRLINSDLFEAMDKNDQLMPSEVFKVRSGKDITRRWPEVTGNLRLDAVRVLSNSGRFELVRQIALSSPSAQERAYLLSEGALYQQNLQLKPTLLELISKELPAALRELENSEEGLEGRILVPPELVRVAAVMAASGNYRAAEDLIEQAIKSYAKGAGKNPEVTPIALETSYPFLRASYQMELLRPVYWPKLTEEHRLEVEKAALSGKLDAAGLSQFTAPWLLYQARAYTGPHEKALHALKVATEKARLTKNDEGLFGGPDGLVRTAREWRKRGEDKTAQALAQEAVAIFLKSDAAPDGAVKLAKAGFSDLSWQTFQRKLPKRGASTDFYELAYAEATAFPSALPPRWLSQVKDKMNRLDALSGFVVGHEATRKKTLIDEESELILSVLEGTGAFPVLNPLNFSWDEFASLNKP